jgi:hypothetical protein
MTEVPNVAIRQRTFLKGTLYYDNRRASIECLVRDISDSGARITFEHPVNVADSIVSLRQRPPSIDIAVGDSCLMSGAMIVSATG